MLNPISKLVDILAQVTVSDPSGQDEEETARLAGMMLLMWADRRLKSYEGAAMADAIIQRAGQSPATMN
jgi:hypothetical protein